MKYAHRFRVEAPSADVVEFHQRSASMAAITPPPIIVRIYEAPAVLGEGDEMAFTLWLGPLPMRWQSARIEQTGPSGFADRLIKGPFASWVHQHVFVETGSDATGSDRYGVGKTERPSFLAVSRPSTVGGHAPALHLPSVEDASSVTET